MEQRILLPVWLGVLCADVEMEQIAVSGVNGGAVCDGAHLNFILPRFLLTPPHESLCVAALNQVRRSHETSWLDRKHKTKGLVPGGHETHWTDKK